MAEDALAAMLASQAEEKLDERVNMAQQIAGLAGWIATSCRPDGYFAYVALSQYLANGLTQVVWDALLRWAAYLASTPEVRLTYRASRADWVVYADSSLFNAGGAASFGGYVALFPGSGVFAWKSFVPRKLGLASGAAETVMAAHST